MEFMSEAAKESVIGYRIGNFIGFLVFFSALFLVLSYLKKTETSYIKFVSIAFIGYLIVLTIQAIYKKILEKRSKNEAEITY